MCYKNNWYILLSVFTNILDLSFLVYIAMTFIFTDILDLAWSVDDSWLASCSVDNTIVVWNADKFPGIIINAIIVK